MLTVSLVQIVIPFKAWYRHAVCHYAECHILIVVMLGVVILSVLMHYVKFILSFRLMQIILGVVMLSVAMPSGIILGGN